jgi:hypoxanthine-DNA glycosylase
MPQRVHSFAPVARRDARVLILGSMPSVRSLADGQYYAHPQNQLWTLLGELVGAGRELPYRARLRVLRERGIALWDVAHSCERAGSADAAMRGVQPNDIRGLLRRCPKIAAVFLNGRKAQQLFTALVAGTLGTRAATLHVETLPSTSPAHASMPRAVKLARWRKLAEFLPALPMASRARAGRARPRP